MDELNASLKKNFGFDNFRHGQSEAIQALLAGQHTLVVMPTGSGKSLIYQFVALNQPGLTLVISPLIALMKDQVDSLARREIPVTFINSTLTVSELNQRLRKLAEGAYRLVYVAPERLRSSVFLESIRKQKVNLLAVDEAHCISEWGHDFRPDYLHIAAFRKGLDNPLTVALTATATPKVQEDIIRLLGIRSPATATRIITGFNRPNLALEVRYTADPRLKFQAVRELLGKYPSGATIIYVGTRRDAEEVAEFVQQVIRQKAEYYHAGLEPKERTRVQNAFSSEDLPVVVATNAFGMGIDRPDVRQVIHFSMPSSLEAYYQEAGRAGRDDLPAQAVLLYDPRDRALQEWFIENNTIIERDLQELFEVICTGGRGEIWVTIDELSLRTGFQETKLRVGLAELERGGMIERLGDEGYRMLVRCLTLDKRAIQHSVDRITSLQRYRLDQLKKIIEYAEANTCRRRIILKHFGDPGPAEASDCCDNCRAKRTISPRPAGNTRGNLSALSQPERSALIILDTVRRLKYPVGRDKLSQILKGSKAADIQKFHYDQHVYYGRFAVYKKTEIANLVDQLINLGYLKVIGGKYPVVGLSSQGEIAIQNKTPISLHLPREGGSIVNPYKKPIRSSGSAEEYTIQLLNQGLTPDQISKERCLTVGTIYGHLAHAIVAGLVSVEKVVPVEIRQQVEAAIEQVGTTDALSPIKQLLPEQISYGMIRCVVEGWKLQQSGRTTPEGRPQGSSESEAIHKPDSAIERFLSHSHPRRLSGPWQAGWALDFHSSFAGMDWNRSTIGALAYSLKYQGDLTVLPALVDHSLELMAAHPEFTNFDAILPVPSSTPRPLEPVDAYAEALSVRLGIPLQRILSKTRPTEPQKEMHTLAQKHANVAGAFRLLGNVSGQRLLVVDDLYDSGATLEEITRLLLRNRAAWVCVLTMTRTIHSDA